MSKIGFWRWQPTDELGMPCPTRFPMADAERKQAGHSDQSPWSLAPWNAGQPRTDIARGTRPE